MNGLKPVDPQAPEEMRTLATRLRRLLDGHGVDGVRDASDVCGLSRTTVSDALGGSRAPTWNTVSTLLKCCRVPPDTAWRRLQEDAKRAEREWRHSRAAGPVAPAPTAPGPAAPASAVPGTFTVRAPYGELPPRVRGRDGLLSGLRRDLDEDRDHIQVLYGLGGCGKTTVALRLARLVKDLGHQVFWVSAATQDSLLTGMRQVARHLAVPERDIEDAWSGRSSAMDLVWHALDRAEQPWLLVVDNADEPDRTTSQHGSPGDGTGWIRPSGAGLTVVTTRIGNPSVWGTEARCRPVDVLSPEDGAEVLVDFAGNAGPMEDARALARRLGGMPLALKLAGSYLARAARGAGLLRRRGAGDGYVRDFAGYARELDRLGTGLLDRGEGNGPEIAPGSESDQRRYRKLISSTWEISLDLLTEQGLPEARLLMRLMSCFAPAPLPAFLLDLDVLEESGLFPDPGRAEHCETALEGLVDLGLLTVEDVTFGRCEATDETAGYLPCLTVHPLVLETNALRVQEASDAERERIWGAAAAVAFFASRVDSRRPDMWKVWKLILPHIEAGARGAPATEADALALFLTAGDNAYSYTTASNSRDSARSLRRLLVERAGELPQEHPVRDTLGRLFATGVEAAHARYRSTLARQGEEAPETLLAHAYWADELRRARRLAEAEREYGATLDILRRRSVHVGGALSIHAQYVQVLAESGRAQDALAEARSLLALLESGHEDGDDVAVRHHVAHALEEAGLLAEAERAHRDQLRRLDEAGEQDSVLYLDTSSLLCGNLVRQERHCEALTVVDGILERYHSIPEASSAVGRNVVKLHQQRAELYDRAGRFEEATADLCRALEGLLDGLPAHHDAVLGTRFRLVHTCLMCGRHAEAAAQLDAVDDALRAVGEGREQYHRLSLLWRARAACEGGSCATAVPLYEQLLSAVGEEDSLGRLAVKGLASCRAASA